MKQLSTRNVLRLAGACAAVAIAIVAGACSKGNGALSASGTVEATEARLGFVVAGRLETVTAHEGDKVDSGTQLATLDRAEMQARLTQAKAQADAAAALLRQFERGSRPEEIAQGEAALQAATDRQSDATRDLERVRTLFEGGAVSREALDKAQTAYDVAASQVRQATEQLSLLRKGPRVEQIEAQRAQEAQARAAQGAIEAALANMIITAPFPGVVSVRHREPGETVPLGAPVLTLSRTDDRWIRIYVPENRIGAVKLGAAATITCDTYPGKTYRGEVIFIATEAEFTPKSVQTSEERVKLVYAVKVRIVEDPDYDLKIGVPADVTLDSAS
jgi:HlyD family secretion protein